MQSILTLEEAVFFNIIACVIILAALCWLTCRLPSIPYIRKMITYCAAHGDDYELTIRSFVGITKLSIRRHTSAIYSNHPAPNTVFEINTTDRESGLLDRFFVYQLPRIPTIKVYIWRQCRIQIGEVVENYNLIPVFADMDGLYQYSLTDANDSSGEKREHWFFDFVVSGQELGTIQGQDGKVMTVTAPIAGHIFSFQVQSSGLLTVKKGDILLTLATKDESVTI